MQETALFKKLHDFDMWANRRTLDSLAQVADREPKAVTLMAHAYTSWQFWLDRMAGVESEVDWFPEISLEECRKFADRIEERSREFAAGLQEKDLEREVTVRRRDGSRVTLKIRDILLQLVTHCTHHRGQINLLVRGAGGEPVQALYIQYTLAGR